MTQTVTVTQASIADLIEQRDGLLEALKSILDGLVESREDIGVEDWIEVAAAAIAKASPIAGLTEIGEEEIKNSTASQSEPVLTPKRAIGDAANGGPKHTPGPWSYWHDTCAACEAKGEKEFVIDGPPDGSHGQFSHEPDARLIATAPELLEVAQVFLAQYPGGINPGLDCARTLARVAIAKADGRTPTSRSAPDDGALAPLTPGDSGRTQP